MKTNIQIPNLLPKFIFSGYRRLRSRRIQMAFLAGAVTICNTAACMAHPANEPYTVSFQAGRSSGIGGTELMNLVAHQGKLFAGTGFWEDSEPYEGPQILRLDSSRGSWIVERTFSEKQPDGTLPLWRRVDAMQEVTFNYDGNGCRLPAPVSLLIAANDTYSPLGVFQKEVVANTVIFTRDDCSGTWVRASIPLKSAGIRSFGFYHDPKTNVDYVFAGTCGHSFVRGVYSEKAPGKIAWDPVPEGANPSVSGRIMSFCQFQDHLYASTKPTVYEYTGGDTYQWQQRATYQDSPERNVSGLRGLTAVEYGKMIGVVEGLGSDSRVLDFFPETTELNITSLLKCALGTDFLPTGVTGNREYGTDILGAYNNIPAVNDPVTRQTYYLVGLGMSAKRICPFPGKQHSSWFLARRAPYYWTIQEIPDLGGWTDPQPNPPAVRTIAVSPFAEDHGQVLFMGFYDAADKPCHNTAHIYRVGLLTALQPYSPPKPKSPPK
jgi:hypothetical protein